MKIPKKINPDSLRDSIVEVRYEGNSHHLVIISIFYTQLITRMGFKLIPPPQTAQFQIPLAEGNAINFNPFLDEELIFANEKIRVKVSPGTINFNCIGGYLGWAQYSQVIKEILTPIHNSSLINHYKRVGVRYISQYDEAVFKSNVKFSFNLPFGGIDFANTVFKTEFHTDEFRVLLNLNTRQQKKKNEEHASGSVAFIDIDVIKEVGSNELDQLFSAIESAHEKETFLFFSLLKDEFIETLKPEYT